MQPNNLIDMLIVIYPLIKILKIFANTSYLSVQRFKNQSLFLIVFFILKPFNIPFDFVISNITNLQVLHMTNFISWIYQKTWIEWI